jgi:hypothetical protein
MDKAPKNSCWGAGKDGDSKETRGRSIEKKRKKQGYYKKKPMAGDNQVAPFLIDDRDDCISYASEDHQVTILRIDRKYDDAHKRKVRPNEGTCREEKVSPVCQWLLRCVEPSCSPKRKLVGPGNGQRLRLQTRRITYLIRLRERSRPSNIIQLVWKWASKIRERERERGAPWMSSLLCIGNGPDFV